MTAKQWQALDLCLFEIQAENDIPPLGLMGIDVTRRVAEERIRAAQKLLRQVEKIEAYFDSALSGGTTVERQG